MVPPFELSTFADPAGSFTTAAAMVACVERVLKHKFNTRLEGHEGRRVRRHRRRRLRLLDHRRARRRRRCTLVAHRGVDRVIKSAEISKERFGVDLDASRGETEEQKREIIADAEVIFAAAAAGVQRHQRRAQGARQEPARRRRRQRRAAAGRRRHGAVHGRRAAARLQRARRRPARHRRHQVQDGVRPLQAMIASDKPLHLDFRHAFQLARTLHDLTARERSSSPRCPGGRSPQSARRAGYRAARRRRVRRSRYARELPPPSRCLADATRRRAFAPSRCSPRSRRSRREAPRPPIGLVLGSGFEDTPEARRHARRALPPDRQRRRGDRARQGPGHLLSRCSTRSAFAHPETRLTPPADSGRLADEAHRRQRRRAYRRLPRQASARPRAATSSAASRASPSPLLAVAARGSMHIVGFSRQWTVGSGRAPLPLRRRGRSAAARAPISRRA